VVKASKVATCKQTAALGWAFLFHELHPIEVRCVWYLLQFFAML
jgi:hypothetical protein